MTAEQRRQLAAWRSSLAAGCAREEVAEALLRSPLFGSGEWSGAWEYLQSTHPDERKRAGVFYTPPVLAARLLCFARPFLPVKRRDEPLVVLDPACGTGNFLVEAARHCLEPAPDGAPAPRLKLCGIDRAGASLSIARARLAAEFPGVETEFFQADALLDEVTPRADLVAGNPPFVPLTMLSGAVKKQLRERFVFAAGRFNLFTLFMEACVKSFLAPEGVAALVVPDRFLRNTQLAAMRRWLTDVQELLGIVEPPRADRRFGAVVDCVGVVWRNRQAAREAHFQYGGKSFPVSGFPENLFAAPTAARRSRFPAVALGEIAAVRDGIIQSRVGDLLFRADAPHRDCRKLLIGSDIAPGEIHFHDRYVDYRPEVMRAAEERRGGKGLRMRSPEIFTRPKILTRQTADHLIAAADRHGEYFYANTLHGITPDPARVELEYLLCYLNSRRAQEAYRALSGETGRVFAQVKIAILKRLPVILPPVALQRRIVSAARRQTRTGGDETVAPGIVFENFDRLVTEFCTE